MRAEHEEERSEKGGLGRFLLHGFIIMMICLPLGWILNIAEYYGYVNPIVFAPVVLFLSPSLRRRHGVLLFFLAFVFIGLGFLNPIWRPDHGPVPLWGAELAEPTVNGVDPRSFWLEGKEAILSDATPEAVIEAESHVYTFGIFAKAYVVVEDGRVLDFRMYRKIRGADGFLLKGEEQASFLSTLDLAKHTQQSLEVELAKLISEPIEAPVRGRAIMATYPDDSRVTIHYGKELVIYGDAVYQGKNQVGKLGRKLSPELDKILDRWPHYADRGHRYFDFQIQNINDCKLFLEMEEEKIEDVWAVFPLPMDFRYRGENVILEPYEAKN